MPAPKKSLDDLPLAAYGGSGMEEEAPLDPPAGEPTAAGPFDVDQASAGPMSDAETPAEADAPTTGRPSMPGRLVTLLRTSRVAQGGLFVGVILVGLILLSGSTASPSATAATPTIGPTAIPTTAPPSGDASLVLTGAVSGTFPLTGLAGGQQVSATTVMGSWGDAAQTTLAIAGPLDRGTRTTDDHLTLSISVVINGAPVAFTSAAGECTIGMAEVGTKVQGSFTCHKLKSTDGKLTIEASGTYRT
jgi:hypothetical protein